MLKNPMQNRVLQVVVFVAGGFLSVCPTWAQDQPAKRLVEVARFKTGLTMFNDLLLTTKGDLLLVQSTLGKTEVWDVLAKKRLWGHDTDSYHHHLVNEVEEVVWLDQQSKPPASVRTDMRTGDENDRIPLDFEPVVPLWNVQFAMAGRRMFAGQARYADGNYLLVFGMESGALNTIAKLPKGIKGDPLEIRGLGVSPDCRQFMLTAPGGLVLTDENCAVKQRFTTANNLSRIKFLPNGKQAIAAGVHTGTPIYFLDLTTGKVIERKEHRYGTASLEISADGKWAVSGGQCRMAAERNYYSRTKSAEGGDLILWDLTAREPVARLNPAFDSLSGVALSADGKFLATAETGDTDGVLVVYQVQVE
jgi:WD40 repeat protein